MEDIWNYLKLFIGAGAGVLIGGQIIMPLVYGIPRAILLVIRGRAEFLSIPMYLISVIIGIALLYLIDYFLPSIITNIYIQIGFIIGIIFTLLNLLFSSQTKFDADTEFKMYMSRFLKR